ncbi:chromate transporter [Paenibacillus sp. PastF-3]|uniref:chromate transporter n=1 Tax=unclassified Paenibacillus TaxID=185978 RepID=UPI000BA08EC6|nr:MULTISPECIES: chromate transporter [unclassified Paenibacillus]MDH6371956.1 chromate transporter [Paenibacillus sp. PastF-3]OZQ97884.1 ChrA protein [Paenibacillus sp. VTT E-133291]
MEANQEMVIQTEKKGKIAALIEVYSVSTKLGFTSFGGPIAHLGYFHNEYIRRRKWMDERSYADLVALCQFLPGPASSQVGIGVGIIRAGLLGGLVAWLGFTLPSIIALVAFAYLLQGYGIESTGWIHGLKIVAVAIVAHAILGMGQKLTPDRDRVTIAVIATVITLYWQTTYSQVLIIVAAGLLGLWLYRKKEETTAPHLHITVSRPLGILCLSLFFILLISLPFLRQWGEIEGLTMFDSFYRTGSLVFGGGHVVLPLLEREVVSTGLVSEADFLAGYGAVQAVPGPLFTFASYLGAMAGGLSGAIIATSAIFLPAFLLVAGALPFWNSLRNSPKIKGALVGINAAVVGILLAALYDPLWTTAILEPGDFALAVILFIMLVYWKLPPWIIVLIGAAGGMVLGLI